MISKIRQIACSGMQLDQSAIPRATKIDCPAGMDRACKGLHATSVHAYRFTAGAQALNCLDVSEQLVAAGGNGSILFWDRRRAGDSGAQQSGCLTEFSDTHEAEVTQV